MVLVLAQPGIKWEFLYGIIYHIACSHTGVEDYWEITGDYWRLLGGYREITGDYATHSSCMLSYPRIGGKLDRPSVQEVQSYKRFKTKIRNLRQVLPFLRSYYLWIFILIKQNIAKLKFCAPLLLVHNR